jgi:hypothetical protein
MIQDKKIDDYHPIPKERVRRKYLENGPCQPRTLRFPATKIGGGSRRFVLKWFDEFGGWLEKTEHVAFIVFCLEKRRMPDMILLLKMVGMVSIENRGCETILVMLVTRTT